MVIPPERPPEPPGTQPEYSEDRRLVWDSVGDRIYHTGIDKGVLFLQDGRFAVWNGLTSIEDAPNSESKSYFLDGIKYLESVSPSDFTGKLTAFTYPNEFDEVVGIAVVAPGFRVHEQTPKSFNLTFRTRVGNDVEGEEYGYKIHILYNVVAKYESTAYSTQQETMEAVQFSWTLTGTPDQIPGLRPAVHISLDSRTTPPEILELIEAKLYGTKTSNPSLPRLSDIGEYYGYRGALLIVDFGDGTWLAIDESDTYINFIDEEYPPEAVIDQRNTIFEIAGADATFIDADTYQISSTNVGEQGPIPM